jgi:hypothetical protein
MADKKKRKWFKPPQISTGPGDLPFGDKLDLPKDGIEKTNGKGRLNPITIDGERYPGGLTPDSAYPVQRGISIKQRGRDADKPSWVGDLIDAHFDSNNFVPVSRSAKERYDDRRQTLQQFGDWGTDYFMHDLQMNGNSPVPSLDPTLRSDNYKMITDLTKYHSGWENQDPVIYGFEIIIDALSSPLLNGSISDFLSLYPNVSELQSRKIVYHDFKKQFQKIFRTKGSIHFERGYNPYPLMSDEGSSALNQQANAQGNEKRLTRGKLAYLAHYLFKIEGIDKLVEGNTGAENNYLVDYGKDLIKLSFSEDVSGTLSSLAHMYKLLYWSRPNGKGLIPENLLRFNCEIVIHEIRNFNRIRPVMQGNNTVAQLESLRDNVSRYIYSLRECQFYFDKMAHDASIDMGSAKTYDAYDVNFDFKYSSLKYEKWVSDPNKFGKYIGYNGGALWKVGNKGARLDQNFTVGRDDNTLDKTQAGNTGGVRDSSVPVFYTSDTDTLGEPGVKKIEKIKKYQTDPLPPIPPGNPEFDANGNPIDWSKEVPPETATDVDQTVTKGTTVNASSEDGQGATVDKGEEKPTLFEKFKEGSKKRAVKLGKKVANSFIDEFNNQMAMRTNVLNATINNIQSALGMLGLDQEPKNVYPKPYTPYGFGIFFDVRNELYNFAGEGVASAIAGFDGIKDPYSDPSNPSLNPFGSIVQKFGSAPTVLKNNAAAGPMALNAIVQKYGGKPINLGKLGG